MACCCAGEAGFRVELTVRAQPEGYSHHRTGCRALEPAHILRQQLAPRGRHAGLRAGVCCRLRAELPHPAAALSHPQVRPAMLPEHARSGPLKIPRTSACSRLEAGKLDYAQAAGFAQGFPTQPPFYLTPRWVPTHVAPALCVCMLACWAAAWATEPQALHMPMSS